MTLSPDSPSIIAISITAIAFTAIGIGIIFAHRGTPAAIQISDAVAKEAAHAPAEAVSADAPKTVPGQEAGIAKPEVREMELWWRSREMEIWWQSTHHKPTRRKAPKRLDTAKLTKLNARIAEESWGSEPGSTETPRYLGDTSRWPLHGPGLTSLP
jgi:hypothetical protein